MKSAYSKFVILTERRCGSNFLCYTLDSNRKCFCFTEIFSYHGYFAPFLNKNDTFYNHLNTSLRDSNLLDFINDIYKCREGIDAIGAKVFYDHIDRGGYLLLRDKSIKKIILYRDSSARFISLLQLTNSLEWYNFNYNYESSYHIKVFFSPLEYLNFKYEYLYSHKQIMDFIISNDHLFLVYSYNDLFLEDKYCKILDFLDLQYDNELNRSKLIKQGYMKFKDRIANYNEAINFFIKYFPDSEVCREFFQLSYNERKCDDIIEVEIALTNHLRFIKNHTREISNRSLFWKNKYFNNIFLMLDYLANHGRINKKFNNQLIVSKFKYNESEICNIYLFIGDILNL